jgi:hypothetical protein
MHDDGCDVARVLQFAQLFIDPRKSEQEKSSNEKM